MVQYGDWFHPLMVVVVFTVVQSLESFLYSPKIMGNRVMEEGLQRARVLPDRQQALRECLRAVRRGGTVSLSGVYMGPLPLAPLGNLFDRQVGLHMGQANVLRWMPEILPLVDGGDPLGTADLVTHVMPLERAPEAYAMFQRKEDGVVKVVLRPEAS